MSDYIALNKLTLDTFKNIPHEKLVGIGNIPKGSKIIGVKFIKFKDIGMSSSETNRVRWDGLKPDKVRALQESFKIDGWDLSEPLPIVVKNGNSLVSWGLLAGHHRCEAAIGYGLDGFYFVEVEIPKTDNFSKETMEDIFSYQTNRPHKVQTPTTYKDVAHILAQAMQRGEFGPGASTKNKNGEDYIDYPRYKLESFLTNELGCSFIDKGTITKICNLAHGKKNTRGIKIMSVREYNRLYKDDPITHYPEDSNKKYHLILAKDGQERKYTFIFNKWVESNYQKQYGTVLVDKQCKDENELNAARRDVLQELEDIFETHKKGWKKLSKSNKFDGEFSDIFECKYFVAQTIDEINSGKKHIPAKEVLTHKNKVKATKPVATKCSIVQTPEGKKIKSNKLNKVLDLE